jgi:membrane protein
MRRWIMYLRRTIASSVNNDVLMLARAGAYSAIICVFPIVLLAATMVVFAPSAEFVRAELRSMLYQMFPPDIPPLVLAYFQGPQHRSLRVILSAAGVFVLAANSVMTTLMESMRRAYRLPDGQWTMARQIFIAFLLTFFSFFPLALASMFVVFGHQIESWMNYQSAYDLRPYVLLLARLVRWALAVTTSITVLAIIYHLGTPRTQSWRRVLPGSILATALWFPSTLAFGWYVTRHAHYRQVYGSLGAGVALLVWLYIVMVSVMIGAEFNAQVFPKSQRGKSPPAQPPLDNSHNQSEDRSAVSAVSPRI